MKRNICLQSTLRQPVRTLFLLLLMGLISFAFISRAAEYLVASREINRLAGYFRAIGILGMTNPSADVHAGIELVSRSQHVDYADWPQSISVILQGYRGHYVSGVLAYGELMSKSHITGGYQFIFQVDQVAAGSAEYVREGVPIRLHCSPENPGEFDAVYDSLAVGGRYLVKAHYEPSIHSSWLSASENFVLKPLTDNGLWFLPVEPRASANFADPALEGLAEELRVMRENQRTIKVYGTKDMNTMPIMQESARLHYLAEGRWLDRLDDLHGSRVCVVRRDFAAPRGLTVGDTIALTFLGPKAPANGDTVPGEDVWRDYETYTEEFEIVGLYGGLSFRDVDYSTIMYIPEACMPVDSGGGISLWGMGTVSGTSSPIISSFYILFNVVLHSPQDAGAFLAENQASLDEMGLRVSIMENGWENFQTSAAPMRHFAALNVTVFALVLVLALSLSAILYLRQRRRDFAILRALGVPKPVAIRQMLWPMALVGVVGVLMGGLPSWRYALGKAAETLASLQGPRTIEPSAALSPIWLIGLCAGIFTLLLLFTAAGTLTTTHRPVLELLQQGTAAQAAKKADTRQEPPQENFYETHPASSGVVFALGEASSYAGNPGFAPAARYVLRHIRRAPLKSVLTVAVALCFTVSLGWMSWTMERNEAELDRLYRTTQVDAEIIRSNTSLPVPGGFIRTWTVENIMQSEFVQSANLEAAARASLVVAVGEGDAQGEERAVKGIALHAFDQPERFYSVGGKDISVEYAAGWDESLFAKDWTKEWEARPVLLPVDLMALLQLDLGDAVLIHSSAADREERFVVAGQYAGTVIGGIHIKPILLPTSALKLLEGDECLYSVAEFVLDPAKNRELTEFRARMKTFFNRGDVGLVGLEFLFWDGELTQVVEPLEKNLLLMSILYPVTVAVSVLIAAGLAVLLMLQAAKEAAMMRVLGTTKARARAMLCGEQLSLCLVGLLLGLTTLIILRQDASAVLVGPAMACAALYLAGTLCGALPSAVSVTNRMPLELLQVKE